MPLHRSDCTGVRLKHEDWLLLFEVPNGDKAVHVSSQDLTTRLLSPLEAPHILFALQCEERLDKSLFTGGPQIKDCNGAIRAACYDIVVLATDRQAFDLGPGLHLNRHNLLKGSRRSREDSQVALGVTDGDTTAHIEL